MTIGAVVISSNTNHGGDQARKLLYTLTALLAVLDQVYYVDWNSPNDKPLIDVVSHALPRTGKLHVIVVNNREARSLTHNDPDAQVCVEVLARNIGVRRLTTDWIISANADVMPVSRENILAHLTDTQTFYTVARRNVAFQHILDLHLAPGSLELLRAMEAKKDLGYQYGVWDSDPWSLISSPGDFQIAHRSLWETIKGFEETMIYRLYSDTNAQRKAVYYGYRQRLLRDLILFHFDHDAGTDIGGGKAGDKRNDLNLATYDFRGTSNPSTWGYATMGFPEKVI